MAEAVQTAYRSSTTEIQQKIRRLIEVWRSRNVFEVPIQDAIEARLDEIDKTRPAGKKALMGGSLFGSSSGSGGLPKELESLAPLQLEVSKANLSTTSTLNTANTEYNKINDQSAQLPTPPLHAARLSALLKSLAIAESSVAESVKARKALITELEKILETNRTSLNREETTLTDLQTRKTETETKRRDVEDNIRRAANAESDTTYNNNGNGERSETFVAGMDKEMDRPEYEALTPPPIEALTPPGGSPRMDQQDEFQFQPLAQPADNATREVESDRNPDVQNLLASMSSAGATIPPRAIPAAAPGQHPGMGTGMGMSMNGYGGSGRGNNSKKRKVGHQASVGAGELPPGFGLDLDEDVAEMIRQESGGGGGGGGGLG